MNGEVVLDTWAVLEYLTDKEPAASVVAERLESDRPHMSWINVGEVAYVIERLHGLSEAEDVVRDLRPRLTLDTPDGTSVMAAAHVKANHRMSLADAFAVSLALRRGAEIWTGHPEIPRASRALVDA